MEPSDIVPGRMFEAATQRIAEDAKCVDLKDFKCDAESKISEYQQAVVMKVKEDFIGGAQEQFQSIASFETSMVIKPGFEYVERTVEVPQIVYEVMKHVPVPVEQYREKQVAVSVTHYSEKVFVVPTTLHMK